jgi:hypothetical protein
MTATLSILLLLVAPPAVAPAQPLREGSPVRRVEPTAAAGPMRDPLVLVDQGREDVGALGTSLRMEGVDMRLPTGFQRVYRVPGRDDLLMRGNGALFAIFPESVYRATRNGRVAVAPPGTVYSIGMPGALHTQPIAPPQPTFAPGQFDGRVDGAVHPQVDGGEARVDARIDGRKAEETGVPAAPARTPSTRAQAEPRRGILFDEVIPAPDARNPYARLRLGAPRIERE